MIRKIVLAHTKSLSKENIEIDFSDGVNIIIGPKGGGKSTLFDLIVGLKKSEIYQNVTKALENFDLKFVKAVKFNNEEILLNNLAKKSKKEKEDSFKHRNDVISQDDDIKKNLHKSEDIDKSKHDFAKKTIENSAAVQNLIKEIHNFYLNTEKLIYFNDSNINWNILFSIKDVGQEKSHLFLKLNYNPYDFQRNILLEIKKLDDILNEGKLFLNKRLKTFIDLKTTLKVTSNESKHKIQKIVDEILNNINNLNLLLNEEISSLSKINDYSTIFKKSYEKIIDELKKQSYEKSGLKDFQIKSQAFFTDVAKVAIKQKKLFNKLLDNDVFLPFDNQESDKTFLSLELKGEVKFTEDQIHELFKVILFAPKSHNHITKWLDIAIEKGTKGFDEQKIKNMLGQLLKEKVIVLANNQNYEDMSLGEKSIYGMKYKWNKSIGESIFLDQPEDNLDNHTIASEILSLIEKKDEQIFIVTHNANIGILSKPTNVIVANIWNSDWRKKYVKGRIAQSHDDESDTAFYLEGGVEFLKRRYNTIIEGEKYGNKN